MRKNVMITVFIVVLLLFISTACGEKDNKDQAGSNDPSNSNEEVNESGNDAEQEKEVGEVPSREVTPEEYPQLRDEVHEEEVEAVMTTNMGEIRLKLFPKYAPLAVENFITLSENGYYKGVSFHRVIENFMIQGGDPEGTGAGGESAFGEKFEDEFSTALAHFPGALSMANAGPNTNGSQFFIVHHSNENVPEEEKITAQFFQYMEQVEGTRWPEETVEKYIELGGTPHLDFAHTVFGHVIEGMDVVDSIAQVEVDEADRPVEDVWIESITIVE